MALLGPTLLYADLLALPPSPLAPAGAMAFAGVIAKHMALIQAGPMGAPGILTFNSAIFGSLLATMPPSPIGPPTAFLMASHWLTAMTASIIAPGTVSNPSWTASVQDILTIPAAAATVVTAPLAMAKLASGLMDAKADMMAPDKVAKAYSDAFKELQFLTIGLMIVGPAVAPLPSLAKAM